MTDTKEALPPRPEHGIYVHEYNPSKGYSHEVISWESAQAYAAQARLKALFEAAKIVAGVKDKSGVNDDGQAWLMRASRADFCAAILDVARRGMSEAME